MPALKVRCHPDYKYYRMNVLTDHFHPRKRKVRRYTQTGHRATPFVAQGLLDKELDARMAA